MGIEVEIKAHVDDLQAVKQRLLPLCTSCVAEEKSDIYYAPKGGEALFRIRYEAYADKAPYVLFTHKSKHLNGGVEVNEEHEFTASPDQFLPAQNFALALGYEEYVRKEKKGWSMMITLPSFPTIHAELITVTSLGDYLEMECILEHTQEVDHATEGLYALLEKAGIAKSAIEKRYYMEMLKNLTRPSST